MTGGQWTAQRERRQNRDDAREAKRRLVIEWQDKLWLAQNHPCADSVLAWLSENRAEASKVGASRWHLETLPALVAAQERLRMAERFEAVLERARVSHQTLTVQDVLGDSPQNPQAGCWQGPETVQVSRATLSPGPSRSRFGAFVVSQRETRETHR
jgi:hypothetical protein